MIAPEKVLFSQNSRPELRATEARIMLLRSSSTPVLGSLLSSFTDSPNNNNHHHDANTNLRHQQSLNKLPHRQTGCLSLTTVSCHSSPISPSVAEFPDRSRQGLCRAQSEGNLEGLAYASCNSNEDCYNPSQPKKFSGRAKCLTLETIPSFSFYNSRSHCEDDHEEESDIKDEEGREQLEKNAAMGDSYFGLSNKPENLVFADQVGVRNGIWNVGLEEGRLVSEEMHLAKGLGFDAGTNNGNDGCNGGCGGRGGGGGGGEFKSAGGDGGDIHGIEEYYKWMVKENPSNPLFLRNYAHYLYQSKKDLRGAEEYYSRAILADPKDGEILSQYAKLVWELHHDQDRASSYFERAAQASPEDSNVHAAYTSFLWEIEEDEGECNVPQDCEAMRPHFHQGTLASAGA